MFTIIYDKETGNVINISSGSLSKEELEKAIDMTAKDYIVVDELPLVENQFRQYLKVEDGKLVVADRVFTEEEEKNIHMLELEQELNGLQEKLAQTDYKAIKYAEGWILYTDYEPIKLERQSWRNRINEIQDELKAIYAEKYNR